MGTDIVWALIILLFASTALMLFFENPRGHH